MATNHINGLTSFESCHSNIFSIVDLQGIKWKKYHDTSTLPTYPQDDPILKLYAACIDNGVLACWRRVSHENKSESKSKDKENASNKQLVAGVQRSKELWLFWWGKEEINNGIIQEVVEPFKDSLKSDVSGSWDEESAVFEYDLRTLVFKAIHNHLEHRLTSQARYLRLGRWFIKPYDRIQSRNRTFGDDGYSTDGYSSPTSAPASPMKGKTQTSKSTKNINDSINAMKSEWQDKVSIAFSFFLHGDSQVMCAVETAQHDQLVAVSDDLITILSQGGGGGGYIEKLKSQNVTFPIQVVLAPYGLRGALTGESWGPYHESSKIVIDEWSMFYNVQFGSNNNNSAGNSGFNDLPAIMEVIVGGVRMKYPTKLILVEKTLDDILYRFNQDQLNQPVVQSSSWRRSVKSTVYAADGSLTAQQQHTQHKPLDIHRSNDGKKLLNDIVQNAWKSSTKEVRDANSTAEKSTTAPFKSAVSQIKPYGRSKNENRGTYARFEYMKRNSYVFHQRSGKSGRSKKNIKQIQNNQNRTPQKNGFPHNNPPNINFTNSVQNSFISPEFTNSQTDQHQAFDQNQNFNSNSPSPDYQLEHDNIQENHLLLPHQTSQSPNDSSSDKKFPENFHSLVRLRPKSGKYHSAIVESEKPDNNINFSNNKLSIDPLEEHPKSDNTKQTPVFSNSQETLRSIPPSSSDFSQTEPTDCTSNFTSAAFFTSLQASSNNNSYDTSGYNTQSPDQSSQTLSALSNSSLDHHNSHSTYSSRNKNDLTKMETLLPTKRARLANRIKLEINQNTCEMLVKNQVQTTEFIETVEKMETSTVESESQEFNQEKIKNTTTLNLTTSSIKVISTVSVAVKRPLPNDTDNYLNNSILTPSPDDKTKIKHEHFKNEPVSPLIQNLSQSSPMDMQNSPMMDNSPVIENDLDLIEDELKHGMLNYAYPTPPSNEPLVGVNDELLAQDEFLARNNRSDAAEQNAEQYSTVFETPLQQSHHESGNYGNICVMMNNSDENHKIGLKKFNYVPNVTYAKLKAIKYRNKFNNNNTNFNDNDNNMDVPSYSPYNNLPTPKTNEPKTPSTNASNQVYSPRPYTNQVRTPKSIGRVSESGPLSQGPASVGMPKTPGSVRMPGSVTMPGSVPKFPNVRSVRNPNSVNPKTPKSVGFIGSVLTPGKCGLKTPGNPQSMDPSSYPFIDSSATGSHLNNIQKLQRLPEAHSLTFNLFLSDSLLNVFRDRCFDQCPVCVCNFDLRGFDHKFVDKVNHAKDLGLNSGSEFPCSCAFSSIRNRSISFATGLLLEDELEVLTSNDQEHQNKIVKLRRRIETNQNSILSGIESLTETDKKTCLVLIDELIKHESCPVFGPTFTWLVGSLKDSKKNSKFLDIERRSKRKKSEKSIAENSKNLNISSIIESGPKSPESTKSSESSKLRRNFIAEYDTYLACLQAMVASRAVIDGNAVNTIANQYGSLNNGNKQWEYINTIIHPWNYSCSVLPVNEPIASESVSLKTNSNENNALVPIPTTGPEQHIVSLLKTLLPVLQNAVQKSSRNRKWMHMIRVRGPLTWFEFVDLGGQSMDRTLAQPLAVPRFITSNESFSNKILPSKNNGYGYEVGPNGLEQWQRLGLEPNSKKQDIVYITVCPDNLQNQIRGFFKELSSSYETSKLGRHRPLYRTSIKPGVTETMNLRISETMTENISVELVNTERKSSDFNEKSVTQEYSDKLKTLCNNLSGFTADCSLLSGGMYNWNGKLSKSIPTDPHTIQKLKNIPPPVVMFYIIEPGQTGKGNVASYSSLKIIQNWLSIIDEVLSKNPCLKNLCQIQILPALSLPQLNLTKDKFLQSIAFGSFAKAKRASIEGKRKFLEISSKSGPQGFTGLLGYRNDDQKRLEGLSFADQQEFGSKCYLPAFMVADNWFDPRDLMQTGKDSDKDELRLKVQCVVKNKTK